MHFWLNMCIQFYNQSISHVRWQIFSTNFVFSFECYFNFRRIPILIVCIVNFDRFKYTWSLVVLKISIKGKNRPLNKFLLINDVSRKPFKNSQVALSIVITNRITLHLVIKAVVVMSHNVVDQKHHAVLEHV